MNIYYSPHFLRRVKKRLRKNPSLKQKISKQIKLVQQNLQHPSLKTHKLKGKRIDEYSFWIEKDLRITFLMLDDTILFTDIITHDEY